MTGARRRRFTVAIVSMVLLIMTAPVFAQMAVVPGRGRLQQVVELSVTGNFSVVANSSSSQTLTLSTVPANQRLVVTDIWVTGQDTYRGCARILRNGGVIASGACIPINGFAVVSMQTGMEFAEGQTVGVTFTGSNSSAYLVILNPSIHLRGYLTSP